MAIFSLFKYNQSNRIDVRIGDVTVKITTILTVRAMLTSKKKCSWRARNKSEGKNKNRRGNAPMPPRWRRACTWNTRRPRLPILRFTISLSHKKFPFRKFLMMSLRVICCLPPPPPPIKNAAYADEGHRIKRCVNNTTKIGVVLK